MVVGNAVSRGNPQVEYLLRTREIEFVSLPQLIGEDLIDNRPAVVVAGTHGKTTTTALTSFALTQVGMDPGYLIGGVPLDLPSGNELGAETSPFVIEGDEYDSAFDKRSKFIHYRPKVLILNNLEFDHGDIFRDLEDISRSFSHLLRIVPSDGFVVCNGDDPRLKALPDAPWTQVINVGVGTENDLRITDFQEDADGSRFGLSWMGQSVMQVAWKMPGLFNARNLAMATLGCVLSQNIHNQNSILKGQIHLNQPFCPIFQDVRESREGRRFYMKVSRLSFFPILPIIPPRLPELLNRCVPAGRAVKFSPVSNHEAIRLSQMYLKIVLPMLLPLPTLLFLRRFIRRKKIPEGKRINPANMIARIEEAGKKGYFFSTNSDLESFLTERESNQPCLVVFFSNGSFDGVIGRFAESVKNT